MRASPGGRSSTYTSPPVRRTCLRNTGSPHFGQSGLNASPTPDALVASFGKRSTSNALRFGGGRGSGPLMPSSPGPSVRQVPPSVSARK